MKKMIWFTSLFALALVLVVPTIFALSLEIIPAGDQPGYNSDKKLAIYGKRELKQKFVSKESNLIAIGTSIRNPNLKNKKEVVLNLYSNEGEQIRTSILNGQNIEDGDFVKFTFPVIQDSLGVTYSFTLSTPLATPEETIEVFYSDTPTNNILDFTYDDVTYLGGLPMVTYHKLNNKFEAIRIIFSDLISRII